MNALRMLALVAITLSAPPVGAQDKNVPAKVENSLGIQTYSRAGKGYEAAVEVDLRAAVDKPAPGHTYLWIIRQVRTWRGV